MRVMGTFSSLSFLSDSAAPPPSFADVVDVTGPGARDGFYTQMYPFFLRPLIWISSHVVHVIWEARLSLRRRLWMTLHSLALRLARLLLPKMMAALEGPRVEVSVQDSFQCNASC